MPTVLITQCLQRDFVDPIRPGDPIPNKLHVGAEEARRLLGDDPEHSPLAQLLGWSRDAPGLHLVHIRDWHDPGDPRQAVHLDTFGPHCVRDTKGARFVVEHEAPMRPDEHIVDAIGLNDFATTRLPEVLAAIAAEGPLRIGVIGVWTEAKVSYLLYDLATRLGVEALATCSALTASSSRSRHFQALDQLERLLGVRVFHDIAGFAEWLTPGASPPPLLPRRGAGAVIDTELPEVDQALIGSLFRDSARVSLQPLAGGFSGARVYRARSHDDLGHRQADTVVKLGPSSLLGPERAATERIAEILGNNVPTVRGYVDFGAHAGLRYSWASMGQGAVRTFKAMWEEGVHDDTVERVLRVTFEEVLEPFWSAARYERLPLVEYFGFVRFAPHVRANVEAVLGHPPDEELLVFPGGFTARNLCLSYEQDLADLPVFHGETHLVAQLHGDLNFANILVDARDNVWLIDFARSSSGPVATDLAKLENDLLYILTPLASDEDLAEALKVTTALRAVRDLREPLPEAPPSQLPVLVRAWKALRVLRGLGARMCREERNPVTMDLLLLRYAAHTLTFDESSPLQRRWALAAACGHAEDAVVTLRAERALRVNHIPDVGPGTLGLTLCPGRRDKGRDLATDLDHLVAGGARRLLCLLPQAELAEVGVGDLRAAAEARGLQFLRVPIRDQGVPTRAQARDAVAWVLEGIAAGEGVVVQCMGGLGRTGTIAACALVALGRSAPDAIAEVRAARGPRCVENLDQERFVAAFAADEGPIPPEG
ncbi:MAG: isochorismatase family protein [Pseudomonadota bacterium]|nr:isochorismatase family protein [Pseudomonadota bacterium]